MTYRLRHGSGQKAIMNQDILKDSYNNTTIQDKIIH